MSRLLLTAEKPLLDEIIAWCHSQDVAIHYGRIWPDYVCASQIIGWTAVIENSAKATWLMLRYSDQVDFLEF